ncbi:DUF4381 domain-containing protein [Pararhizobium sp. BT-229]|uniref:DUF4381 domain-containing protein n=1 Tax=Pararhizobium sp. BT-229 TaxID=2986923 RepID=UPI0021F726A8|nr:DUF4381 domain-containing protein [Pararhizobium sp. BT-229]MCV9965225.1 DUF4381 domain-containing protein [Pararhizobium sp. BT-229]
MAAQQTAPDPLTETALRSLKDIAVPQPVSWMPQTWGWALLAILLLAAATAVFILWLRRYRANAYRREALGLLDGIEQDLQNPATREQAIHQLAEVLKRAALAGCGRTEVASLSGAAWVRFLDDHGGSDAGHALNALLDDVEYQGGAHVDAVAATLVPAARIWIRRHHVSA